MDDLKRWILKNFICLSYGEFDGFSDLTTGQLAQLKGLVEEALYEARRKNEQ